VRLRLAFFCEKSTLYTAFLLFFRENYATGNVTMAYFSPLADFGAVAVASYQIVRLFGSTGT
nr:hypothetical protein [Bacteroidales bacterium]